MYIFQPTYKVRVGEYVPEKYVLFDIMVINQRTAT